MTLKLTQDDDLGERVTTKEHLLGYFDGAGTPRGEFKIGTEHEKFGFLRENKAPLPYAGERGIEALLHEIARLDPRWEPILERDRIIGLRHGLASITLEPGGQLELSGAPLSTTFETCAEVGEHLRLLQRACAHKNVGFMAMGFHPTAAYDDFPAVPKSRYAIMKAYMPKVGGRGLDMMKRTATVQVNLDFVDERDMIESLRAAFVVSPIVQATFSNSPFVDGKPSGRLSERAFVWSDTDPDRTGFPETVFDEGFGFEAYVDWALEVPMYFVRRGGIHLDFAGASFRQFMTEGLVGADGRRHVAHARDFEDHLTTLFPEVRLKRYIEMRSADCGPWSRICALPALYKGLIYDVTARDEAVALMQEPSPAELSALQKDAAISGLRARFRDRQVLDIARALLRIAQRGLGRIAAATGTADESVFLEPIEQLLDEGRTFAEHLLDLYENQWGRSLEPLWDKLEFFEDEPLTDPGR